MQALRYVGNQTPFECGDVPIPEAGPGEVAIKGGGSGAGSAILVMLYLKQVTQKL
jgi:hypothetical protein